MKQLQWDKLPQQQVGKTLWNEDEPQKEQVMLEKLQMDGVWMEMEEDFKAKQLVINLIGNVNQLNFQKFINSILNSQAKTRRASERTRSSDQETRR